MALVFISMEEKYRYLIKKTSPCELILEFHYAANSMNLS